MPELFAWIQRVMDGNHFSYEVIFVNDGSTDRSWEVIENLRTQSDKVKGIKFRRNYGKSPALYCGFEKAQGNVVITMDADLQDSPDEIPELYRMITKEGYDLVSGYKQKRYDPLSKTIPTKLFNATARAVSGINNLQIGNGMDSFGTEFRYRNPESGKLDGGLIPVDFAMSAAAYGCKTYKVSTVEQLEAALADARTQTVSTLIDIKVLPKTMIHGYLSWWRVGVAQVSTSERTNAAAKKLNEHLAKARQY